MITLLSASWLFRRSFLVPVLGMGLSLSLVSISHADHLILTNGGVVRGTIEQPDDEADGAAVVGPEIYRIRTLTGNLLAISAVDVEDVVYQPAAVEEYEIKALRAPQTAAAQWELAEWARKQELFPQWKAQIEAVLALDKDHVAAQQALTRADIAVRKQERDELMLSRGMVKYRGRYISEREKELIDEIAAERERREEWRKKVKLWRGWLTHRTATYQQKGLAALREIDSPDAIPALEKYLQQESGDNFRLLLVEILPNIDDEAAILKLIEMSLFDSSLEVRKNAFNSLPPEQLEFVTSQYVRQLKHADNTVVRRAGAFLGEIGDIRVVPYLIDALVTTHTYQVSVPVQKQTYSVGSRGPLLPPQIEYQLRTGQLPFGVIIDDSNIVAPPPQTKLVNVNRDQQNAEVLASLQKLTDQNFQFDELQWRNWWNSVRDGKIPPPNSQNS
ncbi:MAG: hypothetical protein CMJ46_06175 [Planctomyces sp.]|nr:hypothetical protein [Planctomyces sp.]